MRYQSRRVDDEVLRSRVRTLAEQRRRFGSPRIYVMLKREGWRVNHKKVERIYREEGLSLRRQKNKKRAADLRLPMPIPERPGQVYAVDFVMDRVVNGRRFKCLTMVDTLSKECPVIEVDHSINGERLCRVFDRILDGRSKPEVIMMDNGPEFAGKALDAWAYRRGIKLQFIRPGKPVENCFIESFNDKFRGECLNENWFLSLLEAQRIIEAWRCDYNEARPHSALNDLTPMEWIRNQQKMAETSTEITSFKMV
jgi:putative transposase